MVHEPAQELHRQVLEGERRTVKQLEHEVAHAVLHQRRHCGMPEVAIGFARHAGEVVIGDGVAHERPHRLDRHLGIGRAGGIRDRARIELGPSLRYIEPAVARKPGQRRLDKVERLNLSPRVET